MTDQIQFNEPGMNYAQPSMAQKKTFLTGLIMKVGLAKSEKQAQMVLVGIGVFALVAMFFAWPSGGSNVPRPANDGITPIGEESVPARRTDSMVPASADGDDLFNF